MRIAFLTNEYAGLGFPDGGLGNYLARVTQCLTERGHDCHVVYVNPWRQPGGPVTRNIGRTMVHVPSLDGLNQLPLLRAASEHARWVLAMGYLAAQYFDALHRDFPFDAVQATNMTCAPLFLEAAIPVVVRLSSYYSWVRENERPEASGADAIIEILEREALLLADAVYAPSELLCRRLLEERGLLCSLVRPPATLDVPPADWDEQWAHGQIRHGRPFVAILGTLAYRKGTDVASRAIAAAWKRYGDFDVHVVGRNDGRLADLLRVASPDQSRIRYHGLQPHARVYPLLRRAHALLLPSPLENLPNAAIEAGLLGTPIVCMRGSSSDELVPRDLLAQRLIAPPGDSEALSTCLVEALSLTLEARDDLGERTRCHVAALVDPNAAADALVGLLASRVADRSDRTAKVRARLEFAIDTANAIVPARHPDVTAVRLAAGLLCKAVSRGWSQVVVMGAGLLGAEVCRQAVRFGVEVVALVESHPGGCGTIIANHRVVGIEDAVALNPNGWILASVRYAAEMHALVAHAYQSQGKRALTLAPDAK